jgi:hypothetical protein
VAATELTLRNSDARVKLRNPVTSAVLDVVTIGIYGFFWYFFVNREMADMGRARGTDDLGDNPVLSLLALIPGAIIIVPAVLSMWNTAGRLKAAQRVAGIPEAEQSNQVVSFVLELILFPVAIWYMQTELNKVWERETEAGAGALPGGAQAEAPPAAAQPTPDPVVQQPPPPPGEGQQQQ